MDNQLYDILNIKNSASFDDIHNSYILLKNKYKNNKNNVELNKLFEAYNIISSPQSRKLYDCGLLSINLNDQQDNIQNNNVLCENLFLKDSLKNNKNNIYTGSDINHHIFITLAEAFKGCKKTIDYTIKIPCKQCCILCYKCNGHTKNTIIKNTIMGINTTTKVACDICNSTGYTYDHYSNIKCSFCDGKKEHISFVDEQIIFPSKFLICNNCNGTKKYYKKIPLPIKKKSVCNVCSGKKQIEVNNNISDSNLSFINKIICTNCSGNGFTTEIINHSTLTKLDDKISICNLCNLDGYIEIKGNTENIQKEIITQCSKCNGKGVQLIKKNKCKYCNNNFYNSINKKFHLNLFPGIDTGYVINIKNCGEQILYGNPGNLIITVNITTNPLYTRINENLKLTLLIHFVKTITGSIYKIKLPSQEILTINTKTFGEIINPTKLFIFKNKGMPIYDFSSKSILKYGDLFIQFNVIYGKISPQVSDSDLNEIEYLFSKIYEEVENQSTDNTKIINNLLI